MTVVIMAQCLVRVIYFLFRLIRSLHTNQRKSHVGTRIKLQKVENRRHDDGEEDDAIRLGL